MRRIVIASGNRHKVAELRDMIIAAVPTSTFEVLGMRELGEPPEIDESADTFVGNALLKARGIAAWLRVQGEAGDTLVVADDSGVRVDVLDGAPGVTSARYAGPVASDEDNNRRLVAELLDRGVDRSPAHYVCVLALVRVDERPVTPVETEGTERMGDALVFRGRWEGEIRVERRGTGGFGYDPHAWIEGGRRTIAELDGREKARISHRGQATSRFLKWLSAS